MNDIYPGQTLWALNGETVILREISEDNIVVEYKNKLYERPKSIIGQKLLTKRKEREPENIHNCKDCMVLRRGDCFGEKELCKYFVPAPNISKEEINNWPEFGDATYYRLRG